MNQFLKNESLTVFGDGKQSRAFTYIDDVAPYIAKSPAFAKAYNQTFNIGSDLPTTVIELAQEIASVMKTEAHINHLEQREEVVHAYSDHSKFNAVFKPTPEVSLSEGLTKMAAWVHTHGTRESSTFENIEITKKLPESWR
jgi:UDP-glucose 4-epimerase